MELEQASDEREHALDQGGSEFKERSKWVEDLEEEMETCSAQPGGLNASTSAPWSITLLRVIFVYWATKRLRSSFAPALPSPLSQVLHRAQILPLPPPTPHPQSPPQRRPRRERESQRDLYLSSGGVTSYSWTLACVFLCRRCL